ncbi:Homeobox Protein Hox-B9, partial [Manis pentadactyla]
QEASPWHPRPRSAPGPSPSSPACRHHPPCAGLRTQRQPCDPRQSQAPLRLLGPARRPPAAPSAAASGARPAPSAVPRFYRGAAGTRAPASAVVCGGSRLRVTVAAPCPCPEAARSPLPPGGLRFPQRGRRTWDHP